MPTAPSPEIKRYYTVTPLARDDPFVEESIPDIQEVIKATVGTAKDGHSVGIRNRCLVSILSGTYPSEGFICLLIALCKQVEVLDIDWVSLNVDDAIVRECWTGPDSSLLTDFVRAALSQREHERSNNREARSDILGKLYMLNLNSTLDKSSCRVSDVPTLRVETDSIRDYRHDRIASPFIHSLARSLESLELVGPIKDDGVILTTIVREGSLEKLKRLVIRDFCMIVELPSDLFDAISKYCPNLEVLDFSPRNEDHDSETVLWDCSRFSRLHTLHINVELLTRLTKLVFPSSLSTFHYTVADHYQFLEDNNDHLWGDDGLFQTTNLLRLAQLGSIEELSIDVTVRLDWLQHRRRLREINFLSNLDLGSAEPGWKRNAGRLLDAARTIEKHNCAFTANRIFADETGRMTKVWISGLKNHDKQKRSARRRR